MADDDRDKLAEDARFLRTGVMLNLGGYAFRLLLPALSVFVVRLYGPSLFGVFVVAQMSLQLIYRVGSLGLDRAALWWIPRQEEGQRGEGVSAMFFWAVLASALLALVVALPGASFIARWGGDEQAQGALRLMAVGLVPMALMEMSIHASMGSRDMAVRVFVRDVAVPVCQLGGALVLGLLGFLHTGLQTSYLASLVLGAVAATLRVRGLIRRRGSAPWWYVPSPVVRYAFPIWLSELASSAAARLDVYMIAQLMSPEAVGVYAAVTQIASSLRAIRQSFDPVVLALCSQASTGASPTRLAAGFSRATFAVMSIQVPIWAAIVCFDRYVIMVLGHAFVGGELPLVILSSCWLINGVIGLNGVLVLGYGRSDWAVLTVGFTIVAQAILLYLLIPPFGLSGAAFAVAIAYVATNLLQAAQARLLAGVNLYGTEVMRALRLAVACVAVVAVGLSSFSMLSDWARRTVTFALFAVLAATGYFLHARARPSPVAMDDEGTRRA